MDTRPLQAATRFGLGPRADQPLPDDPLPWLEAQVTGPDQPPPPPPGRDAPMTLAESYRIWQEFQAAGPPQPGQPNPVERNFVDEASTMLAWRIMSPAPYRERLVDFWANHFTVSKRSGAGVTTAIGDYMRHAIRPHATGRFADLLQAAVLHPAMLSYLSQNASIGPNSRAGKRSGRGLNENLAREVLELHTVTPAAGYSQEDVIEFAKLLTGWHIELKQEPVGTVFRPANHEPGAKTILGRRFEEGQEATLEALRFLAHHPGTHRNIATKLVRHFVADDPPPEAVARIEAVLRDTGGDLGAAAKALPRLEAAWSQPLGKFRSPQDYITAAYRAFSADGFQNARQAFGATHTLNQPAWVAPQPNGWPDRAADWVSPERLMQRLDWAYGLCGRFARLDPMAVLDTALGPLASRDTRQIVRGAGSPRDALALILASAEFQRR